MPTPETEQGSLGAAAKQVAEHASALARLELELAGLEVKRKLASFGIGAGLGIVAATLLLFAIGFALAGLAATLATTIATWAALLAVGGGLVLAALLLALVAVARIRRGSSPVPKEAIEEAKLTTRALRSDGGR